MRQTIHRHRAGTTTYSASVYYLVPLDDPKAEGNMGLEGFDDESERAEEFPTKAKALAWLRRTIKAHPDRQWGSGRVDQIDWTADEYEWGGDTILDAEERHVHTWSYWCGEGKVTADGEWDERT